MITRISAFIYAFLFVFFASCSNKKKVDAIFYNAQIYTVDSNNTVAEAMAILDGKIEFIGSTAEVLEKFVSDSMVELKNQVIYPGFNDAHCHFVGYATDMYKCQLTGTKSFDEIIDMITAYDKKEQLDFIYGRGWDQNDWAIHQFPNNEKINTLFPEKAVFLKRIDGHAVLVNKYLLDKAQEQLKPYLNTSYVEVKNGKLTGILFDNAMDAVEKLLPKISTKLKVTNLIKAQNECFSLGLTSVTDAGLNYDEINLVDSLQKLGLLKIRMNAMIGSAQENLNYFEKNNFISTASLRVASVKVYADGSLGSRGACLKKPYTDDKHNHGKINISYSRFDSIMDWAYRKNYQMCTHAIGDSSNSAILKLYCKYLKSDTQRRWRIEHAQVLDSKDLEYFKANKIIASIQPTHATSDMYWAEERLGKDRIQNAYTYNTFVKEGISIALGTDFPVEYLNPLYTFYAAVGRRDASGFPAEGFQNKDALSRACALRGMTIDGAYASFEEKAKGSLEKGKYADFVIANFDLMNDSLLKIRNSKINNLYIAGKKVY